MINGSNRTESAEAKGRKRAASVIAEVWGQLQKCGVVQTPKKYTSTRPHLPLVIAVHVGVLEPGQLTVEAAEPLGQIPPGRFDTCTLSDINQGHWFIAFLK